MQLRQENMQLKVRYKLWNFSSLATLNFFSLLIAPDNTWNALGEYHLV